MNPRKIIIVGTMAFTIAIGGCLWSDETNASPASPDTYKMKTAKSSAAAEQQDDFLQTLGASSDEEVYDALYSGQSLVEIANTNGADAQAVIDLQVNQLAAQLNERLASGSLSREAYEACMAELPDVVMRSAYTAMPV